MRHIVLKSHVVPQEMNWCAVVCREQNDKFGDARNQIEFGASLAALFTHFRCKFLELNGNEAKPRDV